MPTLHEVASPGGADLAQIMPELRQRLPDLSNLPQLEPEQARFRLFESVMLCKLVSGMGR